MSNFNNLVIPSCEEYEDYMHSFLLDTPEELSKEWRDAAKKCYLEFCAAYTRQSQYHENRQVKNNGNS